MIVDTSAIMAIMFREPEAHAFRALIESSPGASISAGSAIELAVSWIRRSAPELCDESMQLLDDLGIGIEPVSAEQVLIATRAYTRFGRGHHRAGLNFGDCFSYALAVATGRPLLFKGNDFPLTDVEPAFPA